MFSFYFVFLFLFFVFVLGQPIRPFRSPHTTHLGSGASALREHAQGHSAHRPAEHGERHRESG